MKICLYNVTSCYIQGGLETYYWEMGRALAHRGHDVTLVAGQRGGAWHTEVKLIQFPFRLEQDWPDFGHRFQRLMERLSFASNALDHLLASSYEAIVICKPFDFPVLWWARRRGLRATSVFHTGGTDFYVGDKWFAGAVDHFLGVSEYTANQQRRRYHRPVSVIHNGVDIERFHPRSVSTARREEWGLPNNAKVLISVGRLVGWKGLRTIVAALPHLAPEVCFVVIGSGPELESLREQARELGLVDRVRFAGRVEHSLLPQYLTAADLYVQPSIGEEAFGISVVEAMACGLPVLASRNGGLPEVVAEMETGWLVTPGDVSAWANAIRNAFADTDRLRTFGNAGRLRAETHFSWAAAAEQLESFLKGAC